MIIPALDPIAIIKSKTFHPSLKYLKPKLIILITDSTKKIAVKIIFRMLDTFSTILD